MNLQVEIKAQEEPILIEKGQLDLPEGVPPLTSLYMYIAGSCNLACRHCWIEPNYVPGGRGGQFIQVDYVQKAIQEALPLGLQSVKLTGGEPTLHPQFREIVEVIDRNGLTMHMETNGILIDDDLARFFRNKPNFSHISVSVDGADAATHEALRMVPGSFKKALEGIGNLVKVGIHPQLICTLHQGNSHQIKEMVGLAENIGCSSVKFNHLQRSGRGEIMARNEGLSVQELIGFYNNIVSELAVSKKIQVIFDLPIAFLPLHDLLNQKISSCSVLNILGLLSNGEISLCGIGVTVPELIFGQIGKNNLAEIWRKAPQLLELRRLIPKELGNICGDCIHRDLCLGSCIANSYQIYGKINSGFSFCREADQLGIFPKSRRRSSV